MAKKQYRVTEKAGLWVAGHKVSTGDILNLTTEQAEYEIARGLLEELPASNQPQPRAENSPRTMHIGSAPRTRRVR